MCVENKPKKLNESRFMFANGYESGEI